MGVSFGRSRVADLSFQVFNRAIHPEWFATRAFHRVGFDGWSADIRIIEGGHALVWRSGRARMTEVLAGPETAAPEPGLLFHSPVKHERTACLGPNDGLEYQTCFEVERLDAEVFAHLCEETTLDPTRGDLFHRFRQSNRMAPAPITRIHLEPRARGLSVQTFHSFPEERAIVRTQSLFEVRLALPSR